MRSLLLSPRWLARHALAIVLIVACLRLGWWQWDRARAVGGTAQNLGYALQWPAFGGFVVYAWFRMLRLELRPPSPEESTPAATVGKPPAAGVEPEAGGEPRTVKVRRRYVPPSGPAEGLGEPSDEALAAYNAYLSSLAGPDEQRTKK